MATVEQKILADFMRKALQAAWCMDYDTYCEVMHQGRGGYYEKEKYTKMQQNFSAWYCGLDNHNAILFNKFVEEKED